MKSQDAGEPALPRDLEENLALIDQFNLAARAASPLERLQFETIAKLLTVIGYTAGKRAPTKQPPLRQFARRFGGRTLPYFAELTARERQVLALIVDGKPNKVTAKALGISERTVEVHRGRIMGKLEVRNAAELVRVVLEASHDDAATDGD